MWGPMSQKERTLPRGAHTLDSIEIPQEGANRTPNPVLPDGRKGPYLRDKDRARQKLESLILRQEEGSGTSRTPWGTKTKWPEAVERARKAPLLRLEAKESRKTALSVRCLRVALARGSKGAPARASSTALRLQGGTRGREGGL